MVRLAIALYSYLGLGTRWTGKLLRLILYATLLLPGFIQVGVLWENAIERCKADAVYMLSEARV